MEAHSNQIRFRSGKRPAMAICRLRGSEPSLFLCAMMIGLCFLFQSGTEAAPKHVTQNCGGSVGGNNVTEFAANSAYKSNLDLLLSSLSNATGSGYFRNATVGGRNGPDTVYGMSLCRGDVTAVLCQECVATASKGILQNCRRVKRAIIWYDECKLRYSNRSFLYTMEAAPSLRLRNTDNVSDVSRFMRLLGDTMNDVAALAANDTTPPARFATEDKNFTMLKSLHTLAQCTPDVSSADCNRCLQAGIARFPDYGSQGSQVLMPSCYVRYELYPFYNATAAAPPPTVPPGPKTTHKEKNKISSTTIIAIVVPIAAGLIVLFIGCCFLRIRAKKKYQSVKGDGVVVVGNDITTAESLQFDFGTVKAATNNFSEDNKIGEGGFGAVYKGVLPDGQEVAMKRLSNSSGQGEEEFKNEVLVVAKLQHRNLVRLLGFCLEGEERILVYEFVTNKSLDRFLFDPKKRGQLDWSRRYKIIGGIARGILYLHEESRLRIIHRDLKASNILLDEDMNPKVSDFGMAKIFGVDQTGGNTSRIVGTYGYMSPEYAMHGHFSVKSDVFSFGVLVLEIISGKKNGDFNQADGAQDLLSYAWMLWKDGAPLELIDPTLKDTFSPNEVRQCIHIGLLCVQEEEAKRPTMETVVLTLNSYSVTLPVPNQPAFVPSSTTMSDFPPKDLGLDDTTSKSVPWSVNEVSITELGPR